MPKRAAKPKVKPTKAEEAIALGAAIRARRIERGLVQHDLALLVGIQKEQIRKIESGESYCSMSTLWELAMALKCSPSALIKPVDAIVKTKHPSGVAQLAARLTVNHYAAATG
jgi:transcriptional regulator with XRE-family HTH domain